MKSLLRSAFIALVCGFAIMSSPAGQTRPVRLNSLFSDHMVLQRELPVPVWGKALPGTSVLVSFNGVLQSGVAGIDGGWKVTLPAMPAGGPFELVVAGTSDTLRIRDVMLGDVWVCSGQSNMEWSLVDAKGGPDDVASANLPMMRLLQVEHNAQPFPQDSLLSEGWKVCSPSAAGHFSAVGYYFGKELLERDNVAIGLIHSSWGGTVAEAWTSLTTVKTLRSFTEATNVLDHILAHDDKFIRAMRERVAAWYKDFLGTDPGLPKKGRPWHDPGLATREWKTMELPSGWEARGLTNFDGVVWFRKEIELPASWKGKQLTLSLGPIDDADVTWFNGKEVGGETVWNHPRVYTIPAKLVRSGKNIIAVRVLDTGGGGGLFGMPPELFVRNTAGDSLSLVGAWQYKIAMALDKVPPKPLAADNPNYPTVLYNGMIAPLIPYGIRGVIWYQGESNAVHPRQYRRIFPSMIRDWRDNWGQGDFPFLFVQLANFNAPPNERWAELREAQTSTLAVPKTAMAVTIDVGDSSDIHPRDKATVGHRLALAAMAVAYGDPIEHSGPLFDRMEIEGDSLRVYFTHASDGLECRGGSELTGFSVAGIDENFVPAQAHIEGQTVVVKCPTIASPVAVRYGWGSNPSCNLYNSSGLPASPFRTDEWRNSTE